MVFLRKEEQQSITWAGNPEKPVQLGPNGARLTPRASFAAWQEIRKGFSKPWLQKDIGLAQALKQILLEVVIRNIDERERLVRESQQQQDVLVSELNHRVRNILGLISSVVSKTATGAVNVPEIKDVLGGRINSIAVAQNQLTARNWAHAPLKQLFEIELSAHRTEDIQNVKVNGPDLSIAPKAYTSLTLVVHELVTNALKYGALKDDRGHLEIEWKLSEAGDLLISWDESGYENLPSTNKGFGSVIINRSLPFDLNGKIDVEHHGSGLIIKMQIPYGFVKLDKPLEAALPEGNQSNQKTEARTINTVLVLEDNMIIALDLEDTLSEVPISDVHLASNTIEAEQIIKNQAVDFAILDVNLGGENSYTVATLCKKLEIPFVFVTGYNELQGVKNNGFENVPLLMKPVSSSALIKHIHRISSNG